MRLIFSRDRPAQLDLLLRSLEQYAPSNEQTEFLFWPTDGGFAAGYAKVVAFVPSRPEDFDRDLRESLAKDETVTFFCDDNVMFRPVLDDPRKYLADEGMLAFSWRLSWPAETLTRDHQYGGFWRWTKLPRTGHGYPGSIDGHTFRTADVQEMIGAQVIENPTMLETVLALGCEKLADRRPLMAAWPEQVLVGVPVNRVSENSGCPNGERFPQPVEELNARFLAGERIALDRLDFSGVDGCHHEIQYVWE